MADTSSLFHPQKCEPHKPVSLQEFICFRFNCYVVLLKKDHFLEHARLLVHLSYVASWILYGLNNARAGDCFDPNHVLGNSPFLCNQLHTADQLQRLKQHLKICGIVLHK